MKSIIRVSFILTGVGAIASVLILHKVIAPHLSVHHAIADYWPLLVGASAIAMVGASL